MNKVYADDPIKGSVLSGKTDGVRFFREVKRSRHYFRVVKGYAIQKDVIDKLKDKGVEQVVIIEIDTKHTLVSKVEDWFEHGGIWTGKNGKQRTLSEKYMTVVEEGSQLPETESEESWCCGEPPDDYGFCPVCREHIN